MGTDTTDYHVQVVKTRLSPGVQVEGLLFSYTGAVNAVYNQMLWLSQQVRGYRQWQEEHSVPEEQLIELIPVFNFYDLAKYINVIKHDIWSWSDQVSKHVFEDAARALSAAFTQFKRRGYKHYPKYRRRRVNMRAGKHSISMIAVKDKWLNETGTRINLPAPTQIKQARFGLNRKQTIQIPVSKDRRVRRAAKLVHTGRATVQQVTYSYSGGYWWVAIRLRVAAQHIKQYPRPAAPPDQTEPRILGIDASLSKHKWAQASSSVKGYTDSDGVIRLPEHMEQTHKKLIRAQRWLSHTTPGSNRNRKALIRVQRLNHKLAAQRSRWLNQLVTTILQNYDMIIIEDLSLTGMSRRKPDKHLSFGTAVGSGSHGTFRQLLETKQHRYNNTVQVVVANSRFASSKTCSFCGTVKTKLGLHERTYKCNMCGTSVDRDVNAANNLVWYGKQTITHQQQKQQKEQKEVQKEIVVSRVSCAGDTRSTVGSIAGVKSEQVGCKTKPGQPGVAATLPAST